MFKVKGVSFQGKNKFGDFNHMIKQTAYKKSLFLFNDNVLDAFGGSEHPGGGSAVIRPYACLGHPMAYGMPTGWSVQTDGFDVLLETNDYDTVFFPCAPDDAHSIGHGIFTIDKQVRDYINIKLKNMVFKSTTSQSLLTKDDILKYALIQHDYCKVLNRDETKRKFIMETHKLINKFIPPHTIFMENYKRLQDEFNFGIRKRINHSVNVDPPPSESDISSTEQEEDNRKRIRHHTA
jgi:hypothetical protein